VVALVVAGALWQQLESGAPNADVARSVPAAAQSDSDARIAAAFRERRGDLQIEGAGVVVRTLRDDNDGSRHQRFLLELDSGQTLLVAHNIDLAPRISGLERGDRVRFFGEYEWNERGGVIHWTHHDPRGEHVGGWLEHEGRRYE
jgi:hypothetical protein